MRVLHAADTHFQSAPDILAEVVRVTDFIVQRATEELPDVIVLAGDTLDGLHSPIKLDSDAARAAIRFVTACAGIAPVVIVRGTRSHDRDAVYIFSHLRSKYPVHVCDHPEMVALVMNHLDMSVSFVPFIEYAEVPSLSVSGTTIAPISDLLAVFTLFPSLDKTFLEAESIRTGNRDFRELFHDLCSGFGEVNRAITTVPRIFVGHGMVTGSVFSSGQQAIGEDLEMSADALRALNVDYCAIGHVHRFQQVGPAVYCGSPGRLNFGEPEEKGFVLATVDNGSRTEIEFVQTPARRFVFVDCEFGDWMRAVADAGSIAGAHVRLRFPIPEERRGEVNRQAIEEHLLALGAAAVKVEARVVPTERQRAAGISREATLPAKVQRWADVSGVSLPPRVLELAATIEAKDAETLLREVV